MECLGPQCASMVLEWLKVQAAGSADTDGAASAAPPRQGTLWTSVPYQEEAPAIRSADELAGAFEHLHYAVYRRSHNQLTRAERARLDNTIENALFKIERYSERLEGTERAQAEHEFRAVRDEIRESREHAERLRRQAQAPN